MALPEDVRSALDTIRARLTELAQAHPDVDTFLDRLDALAQPILRGAGNDDQRHAVLAELALMACEAGIPGERARKRLLAHIDATGDHAAP